METLIIAVAGLLVIAACNQLAPKVGVASPLILLALGIVVGFLPWIEAVAVDPDLILEAVLPPLLFATAGSMPVMDFRRELRSVAVLAIGLVVISAFVLGVVIHLIVPAISLSWAIALGAVLSPTDAVAVAIARRSGVSHRIITVLEGEGLFNDATALVLLSSAVSAALMTDGDALAPASLATGFLVALLVAVAVGWAVGELTVRLRARITDPAADTVVTFAIPFLASIPAEELGGSGLVAAVVAGLVVSYRGPRLLPAGNRRSSQQNWRTVELILEGAIFLTMGLQAYGIYHEVEVHPEGAGLRLAVLVAVVAGALTVVLRTGFVAPLLVWLRSVRRHSERRLDFEAEQIRQFEDRLKHACDVDDEVLASRNLSQEDWNRALGRWRVRLDKGRRRHERASNDLSYFTSATLGPREGAVIVWAGMRGAVTLAAAQTIPLAAPQRSFLLLVALLVAAGSLTIQGLTLNPLIRLVRPQMASDGEDAAERKRLLTLLGHAVKDTALARAVAEQADSGFQQPGGAGGLTRSFSTVGRAWFVEGRRQIEATASNPAATASNPAGTASVPAGTASVPAGTASNPAGTASNPAATVPNPAATVPIPDATVPVPDAAVSQGEASGAGEALSEDGDGVIEADETRAAQEAIKPLTQAQVRTLAVEAIQAQRDALLEARDEGVFASQTLEFALERLDAEEIMLDAHH